MIDARVKHLRQNATPSEELLWHQLRLKRVGERRFRRQFPLGDFIADFVCLSAKLVVEVDGASHEQTLERDSRRTRWLEAQGFRVLRFANDEVMTNLDGVVQTIALALCDSPLPLSPSREGRGDKRKNLIQSPLPRARRRLRRRAGREGARGRGRP